MDIITRKEAKEQGLKRFYTGVLCIHGHDSERSVSEGNCIECKNESYYNSSLGKTRINRRNKKQQKILNIRKEWNDTHPDKQTITKKEAKEQGLKLFFTAIPCNHGHISDRIIKTGACLECTHVTNAKWRKENHEHETARWKKYKKENHEMLKEKGRINYWNNHEEMLKYGAIYREENREKERLRGKKYHNENKEIANAACRNWLKNNPDKSAYSSRRRRKLLERATPPWYEKDLIKQLYLKRNELSETWGMELHVDHIIPLQGKNVSGLHCWDNLQLLEKSLNLSKGYKFEDD